MPSNPRKPTTFLLQAVEASQWPIVLFGEGNLIRFVNTAAEAALGIPRDALAELAAKYHGLGQLPQSEQVVASICPAPLVWSGQVAAREIHLGGESASSEHNPRCGEVSSKAEQVPTNWGLFIPCVESSEDAAVKRVRHVMLWIVPQAAIPWDSSSQHRELLHVQLEKLQREYRGQFTISQLVGVSSAMNRVRRLVDLAANSRIPVLVRGESGTGREHVARTICYASAAAAGPVVTVHGGLMDADIMGTTVRAFLRQCQEENEDDRASLILLEADELDLGAQSELYHLLKRVDFDLRIIATAKESLRELSQRGDFREDLAYRLSTLEVELPRLADRPEDIPLLAQAIVEELNVASERQVQGISAAVVEFLQQADWPENIDGLNRTIAAAHARSNDSVLQLADFPPLASTKSGTLPTGENMTDSPPSIDLDRALEDYEAEILKRALQAARGNKTQAASLLKISRARLHRRLEQLGIH